MTAIYYQGWQIGGSGYWYDPISWSGRGVPGPGSTVIIATPGPNVGPTSDGSTIDHLDNVTIDVQPGFSFTGPVLSGYDITYGAGVTLNFTPEAGSTDTAPTAVMAAYGTTTYRGAMNLDAPQGSFTIDVGGQLGSGTLALAGSARIAVENGTTLTFSDDILSGVTNNGVITISGHSTVDDDGPTNGSGTFQLQGGGTVQFDGPVLTGQKLQFLDGTGTLVLNAAGDFPLGNGLQFSGDITGFQSGDVIRLLAPSDTPTTVTYLQPYNILAVRDAAGAVVAKLRLDGVYQSNAFALTADGKGNFDITLAAAAVASGTSGNDLSTLAALATPADLASGFAVGASGSASPNGPGAGAIPDDSNPAAASHAFAVQPDGSAPIALPPTLHG
jgi:hypothetical protein